MARKAKTPALYVVKVWTEGRDLPLVSHFLSHGEAADFEMTVQRRPNVTKTDMSPGYMVHTTAKDAVEMFDMWTR